MRPKITVYHAFDGFLYFPLFLAERLDVLPPNTTLDPAGTDVDAVECLRKDFAPHAEVPIAICDPLAGNIGKMLATADPDDRICVVAAFIKGVQLWVCNPDQAILPVKSEKKLRKHAEKIHRIIGYADKTTGGVFARRLNQNAALNATLTLVSHFGEEWAALEAQASGVASENTIVLTADVVRIAARELPAKNIVLDYRKGEATHKCAPYLFTAVLTPQSVLQQHLVPILGVLTGLNIAVQRARAAAYSTVDCEVIQFLSQRFARATKEELAPAGNDSLEAPVEAGAPPAGANGTAPLKSGIVRSALRMLVGDEKGQRNSVYEYLESPPDEKTLRRAWHNAERQWTAWPPQNYIPEPVVIAEQATPIPSLLIHSSWQSQLHNHYKTFFTRRLLRWPNLNWFIIVGTRFIDLVMALGVAVPIVVWKMVQTGQSPFNEWESWSFFLAMVCIFVSLCFAWHYGIKWRKVLTAPIEKEEEADRANPASGGSWGTSVVAYLSVLGLLIWRAAGHL